jgi:drug/metabolite transporter (DMT)-like permease
MTQKVRFTSKGAEALFGASFFYAFTGVLVRYMQKMWGTDAQTAARFSLVFVLFLLYGLYRKRDYRISAGRRLQTAGLTIAFALVVLFFTAGIGKTTLANALFTFYATNMAASFVLGTFLLKEKVTANKVAGILFALVGLGLYSQAIIDGNAGILYCIVAGVAGAVSNVFSKLLTGVKRSAVLLAQYGGGAVFLWVITLLSGQEIIRAASWSGVGYTVIFAFVLMGAASLSLYGYQHFDVNIATVIMSMELVFGAILGWILFSEVPEPHELLGGIIIFAGSVLSSLDMSRLGIRKGIKHA